MFYDKNDNNNYITNKGSYKSFTTRIPVTLILHFTSDSPRKT